MKRKKSTEGRKVNPKSQLTCKVADYENKLMSVTKLTNSAQRHRSLALNSSRKIILASETKLVIKIIPISFIKILII